MTDLMTRAPRPAVTRGSRAPRFVIDAMHRGPTSQVDDSWVILPPDPERWDPFVLLVEDDFSTRGFPWHPHRGFQTLTYVLDGRLEHRDNAGGFGVLGPGDAQYMVAGRYAMHYELAWRLRPVRTLQMWINLPAEHKLGPSSYVDLLRSAAARIERPGVVARVHVGRVAGHDGADERRFKVPITLLDAELRDGASFRHYVPGDHVVALHVVSGALRLGPGREPAKARQTAWFEAGTPGTTTIDIEADSSSTFIAYSGRPVRERVVFGGPFLMNTEEENRQAMAEFRAGLFGPIPDDPSATDAASRRAAAPQLVQSTRR